MHVKFESDDGQARLGNGTLLGVTRVGPTPAISLSLPEHLHAQMQPCDGRELDVVFSFRNHLMEFRTSILGEAEIAEAARAHPNYRPSLLERLGF